MAFPVFTSSMLGFFCSSPLFVCLFVLFCFVFLFSLLIPFFPFLSKSVMSPKIHLVNGFQYFVCSGRRRHLNFITNLCLPWHQKMH